MALKRLRVRLRATERESLAETFGPNLFTRGVFLKSKEHLPIGTSVVVELLYRDGALALTGRGTVEAVSSKSDGMSITLQWSEESETLVQWVIERRGPDPFEAVTVFAGGNFPVDTEEPQSDDIQETAPNEIVAPDVMIPMERPHQIGSIHFLPIENLMPAAPPPPIAPPEVLGQRPGSKDTWDLVSDLIEPAVESDEEIAAHPAAVATRDPRSDLDREAMADAFEEMSPSAPHDWGAALYDPPPAQDANDVTPLARIELVRTPVSEPIRTSDIEPLVAGPKGKQSSLAMRRSSSSMAPPSAGIMAIDFGTVNTRAACSKDDEPRIIESRRGTEATPSVVMIKDSGKTIVGEPALRKLSAHPDCGILESRRLIGLPFASERVQRSIPSAWCDIVAGEHGETAIRVGPFDISIEEIAALLLKEIRESALMAMNQRVNRAVVTCPAPFGFRQREAMRVAARLAGVYVERLIAEPVAVAVHAMQDKRPGRVFVYRLGGGTFDATIVSVDGDKYEVVASESELFLGGVDFDAGLASLLAEEVHRATGLQPKRNASAMALVMEAARKAKHLLSTQAHTSVMVEPPANAESALQIEIDVARDHAEKVWMPLVDRTIALSQRVLRTAGLDPKQIDHVVIAGGQARAPLVQRKVRALLGREPLDIDPERAAVLGAAIIAGRIDTAREIQTRELLGTSLFIRKDAQLTPVLKRGAPMPTSANHTLWNHHAKKTAAEVIMCEGPPDATAETAEPIGRLTTEPFLAAAELRFDVTADGLLAVSASEFGTRRRLSVELISDVQNKNAPALKRAQPERSDRRER